MLNHYCDHNYIVKGPKILPSVSSTHENRLHYPCLAFSFFFRVNTLVTLFYLVYVGLFTLK